MIMTCELYIIKMSKFKY